MNGREILCVSVACSCAACDGWMDGWMGICSYGLDCAWIGWGMCDFGRVCICMDDEWD